MDISNNHTAALTLPNGQVVPSRVSVKLTASDWSDMKDHRIVKAWIDEKKLTKGADPEPEPEKDSKILIAPDGMTDDELKIYLKDNGVTTDGRWGRDKLLAEVKKIEAKG